MLNIFARALVRPHRWLGLLASTTALLTNLKQLSEITTPGGDILPFQESRFVELARLVAMETHQVEGRLGIDDSNPNWALAGRIGSELPERVLTSKDIQLYGKR